MNPRKNLSRWFALPLVFGLALAPTAVWEATRVRAQADGTGGGSQGMVSFPLGSAGLVPGESLRAILVNRGKRPLSVQVSTFDADGLVVKEETLSLEPGRTRAFEAGREGGGEIDSPRAAASTGGLSVPLRMEAAVGAADINNLWAASEVLNNTTGSTKYTVRKISLPPGDCDEFGCGSNHSETLVRDTSPTK